MEIPNGLPRIASHTPQLPLAAALVHHGGIGTAAQAIRAACPQLIMPMAFDQPDNADRLYRLGIGRSLWPPSSFTGRRVANKLNTLLGSSAVSRACYTVAQRFVGNDPISSTCALIESVN